MTSPRTSRPAFTLLELMISVALALLMILGINEVFSLTSKTVGAGQSLTSAFQYDRSAQGVIAADFQQAAPMSTTPGFIIESAYAFAFRNKADQLGDSDGRADTMDLPAAASPSRPPSSGRAATGLDRIGFFSRGFSSVRPAPARPLSTPPSSPRPASPSPSPATRRGSSTATSTSPTTRQRQLKTFPGAGTPTCRAAAPPRPRRARPANPNNFYAAQWVLGRTVFLLAPTRRAKA